MTICFGFLFFFDVLLVSLSVLCVSFPFRCRDYDEVRGLALYFTISRFPILLFFEHSSNRTCSDSSVRNDGRIESYLLVRYDRSRIQSGKVFAFPLLFRCLSEVIRNGIEAGEVVE